MRVKTPPGTIDPNSCRFPRYGLYDSQNGSLLPHTALDTKFYFTLIKMKIKFFCKIETKSCPSGTQPEDVFTVTEEYSRYKT